MSYFYTYLGCTRMWNMGVGYVAGLILWYGFQRGWLKA